MAEAEKHIKCPACAHEFAVGTGADLSHLTCPHCEADIPEDALRPTAEVAEEIAPGFRPGQKLGGNFVIESLLGAGGMAVVFKGRQLSLNRLVAIKILPRQFVKNKLFLERFMSEAAVLASLNHPNVVSIIDRGVEGETYFIVMEYVDGETLKDRAQRKGRFTAEETIEIAVQTLAGLEYAHKRGVVHRDIKPGNIMMDSEERVKIADFGLAHLAKSRGGLDVTRENQAMGTLKYMAPEQLTNARNVDARADLYSLGVCVYEMLTGKLPLGMFKMPSECDNALDVRWDDVILRALKMDPEERFSGADEMARALREIATTPRMTAGQREPEEAVVEAKQVAPSLVACAACGKESGPEANTCAHCGATLADLFDCCPGCNRENRVDVPACAGCGRDLTEHRLKLRRSAEAIQTRALQLAKDDKQLDLAIGELKKLRKFHTREYGGVRKNAEDWIERLRRRKERLLQRVYEAGERAIAEGRPEQGIEIWQSIPDSFADVVVRRKQLIGQSGEAKAALAEGSRLYQSGDLEGAVRAWEVAASFWKLDNELRKRIAAARAELRNVTLKRTYMKESEEAAASGNVVEAAALCRRVLEIDPNDADARALLRALEVKEQQFTATEAEAAPEIVAKPPRKPRKPLNPVVVGAAAAGVCLLVVAFLILFVLLPGCRAKREAAAAAILADVKASRDQGKIDEALRLIRDLGRYPQSKAVQEAGAIETQLRQLITQAREQCDAAEALAARGDLRGLEESFRKYSLIAGVPPVSAVESYHTHSLKRIEELRERIGQIYGESGAALERKEEWQEALRVYRRVTEEFEYKRDPVAARYAAVKKRVADCAAKVQAGRDAAQARRWDEAMGAAVAALNLAPSDADARKLLAVVAPNVKAPAGMVLVPPGEYAVGGVEGNPRRTVSVPFGFFMDATEVTYARYSEYLRASHAMPPPGWGEDGAPPPSVADPRLPVCNITCEEAALFAAWAESALPTEEQWECAARGKTGQAYPWGDTWEWGGVFGYGPAPVGVVGKDRSPFGCLDMAGNVAEWTATRIEPPAAPAAPATGGPTPPRDARSAGDARPALFVVKGSSWAGVERDRPAAIVPGNPDGSAEAAVALLPLIETPEATLRYRSSIGMVYLGPSEPVEIDGVQTDTAWVIVRRWVPGWEQWAEERYPAPVGKLIGRQATIPVEDSAKGRAARGMPVDLSTGCVLVRQEDRNGMDVRDPAGVIRRVPYTRPPVVLRKIKLGDNREPLASSDLTLDRTVASPNRMLGRGGTRYINVGFRCVKPLWTPPAPPKPDPEPAKK